MDERCKSCSADYTFVRPIGPRNPRVMLIGEKPGQEEANRGYPFVGPTGEEMDKTYLPLAGLERRDCYITNTVKCRLGGTNNKPTKQQVLDCAGHWINEEIVEVKPQCLVLLGTTACSMLTEPIDLNKDHGILINRQLKPEFGGWSGPIMTMYHPSNGLHNTGMIGSLAEDFIRLRGMVKTGKLPLPGHPIARELGFCVDQMKAPNYQLLVREQEVVEALDGCGELLGVDTEDDDGKPWSLQFSHKPGTGYMILLQHPHALYRFFELTWNKIYALHNAVADRPVIKQMQLILWKLLNTLFHKRWRDRFVDTMQEAYQLRNLPQGAKALAWRLFGVRMKSWEDLVLPHSQKKLINWMDGEIQEEADERAILKVFYNSSGKQVISQKTKQPKIEWVRNSRQKVLDRIKKFSLDKDNHPDYDPWEKLREAGMLDHPRKSIAHSPLHEAVPYGCADADIALRLALTYEGIRHNRMNGEPGMFGETGIWNVHRKDWDYA